MNPQMALTQIKKHEVRTLIREMGRNKAIIFSTHILEEVDAACTRAIIIDRGKIVANGTPDQLRKLSKYAGAVTVRLRDRTPRDRPSTIRANTVCIPYFCPRRKRRNYNASDFTQKLAEQTTNF